MPRILFIVPADYDALKAKGVEGMIFERDEGGFFQRVVTVHPTATISRTIDLDDVHVLHELGFDVFGRAAHYRLLRVFLAPLHLLRVVFCTLRFVRRERIDLIRANDPFWIGLVGMIVAKLSGLPWCVSIHADYDKSLQLTGGGDTYTFFGLRWPAKMVSTIVLSTTDLVLPIRNSLQEWAVANGAPSTRCRVIPHGIDCQVLEAESGHDVRTLFEISSSPQIISFVGRLSPENYLSDLLEAARRLAMRRDDFCLVIAGGGKLEDWLEGELAAEPKLGRVVRLVGFQPRGVCFALRQQSTVSICLMGGFSLIEACLAARPVIAYDVDWHSELVQTDRTGYLLKEGDIDGVAQAMELCLDDATLATELGRQARDLAVDRHELVVTSQIKKECYEELLGNGKT